MSCLFHLASMVLNAFFWVSGSVCAQHQIASTVQCWSLSLCWLIPPLYLAPTPTAGSVSSLFDVEWISTKEIADKKIHITTKQSTKKEVASWS